MASTRYGAFSQGGVEVFQRHNYKTRPAEDAAFRDEAQVALDINRSLWQYPSGIRMSERRQLRRRLTSLIRAVLVVNPELQLVFRWSFEPVLTLCLHTPATFRGFMTFVPSSCSTRQASRLKKKKKKTESCSRSEVQCAFAVVSQLCAGHLQNYMRPSMKYTLAYLDLLNALFRRLDPDLSRVLTEYRPFVLICCDVDNYHPGSI
jgi:hypothetical protein